MKLAAVQCRQTRTIASCQYRCVNVRAHGYHGYMAGPGAGPPPRSRPDRWHTRRIPPLKQWSARDCLTT